MIGLVRRAFQSTVAWSFLGTFLRVGASVFVLPLILRHLPPEHLGLWYVFGTLGAFATLLDLGFENTVARMTAYVWAGAPRLAAFGLAESAPAEPGTAEPNRALFADLLATLRAYYRALGLAVLVLLTVGGGAWVWIKTATFAEAQTLRAAWIVYAIGCCLNFISGRWPALLTGIGHQRTAQQVSIVGLLLYYAVAVTGLLSGFGLWSLVLAFVGMGFVVRGLGRRAFVKLAALPGGIPRARFHREVFAAIWPNAWRLGLVSVGAFLIVHANTLICSTFLDLRTTASYGISFQLTMLLVGVSQTWVDVKMPLIHQLRVRGETPAIARLFAHRIRLALLSYLAGAAVILGFGAAVLQLVGSRTELLPLPLLGSMLLIQCLEMHHSQFAKLVYSENRNPFLRPALISGVAIIGLSALLTPRFGVAGLLLSAGCVQLAFNNWWPVIRGIRGLDMTPSRYALLLFGAASNRPAHDSFSHR